MKKSLATTDRQCCEIQFGRREQREGEAWKDVLKLSYRKAAR